MSRAVLRQLQSTAEPAIGAALTAAGFVAIPDDSGFGRTLWLRRRDPEAVEVIALEFGDIRRPGLALSGNAYSWPGLAGMDDPQAKTALAAILDRPQAIPPRAPVLIFRADLNPHAGAGDVPELFAFSDDPAWLRLIKAPLSLIWLLVALPVTALRFGPRTRRATAWTQGPGPKDPAVHAALTQRAVAAIPKGLGDLRRRAPNQVRPT